MTSPLPTVETLPSKPPTGRILWIDNIRAIGILLVVFIHTGRFEAAWFVYILSFFMPLFFFLSGLFVKDSLREKPFGPFLRDKALRRLVPYFVFNILSYGFWAILIRPMRDGTVDLPPLMQPLLGIFYGVGGFGWLRHNISLWFLVCLFVTEVAFYFLIRLPSKRYLVIALGICSIVGYGFFAFTIPLNYELAWIPYSLPYRLPWGCDLMPTALVFYGAGYLARPYVLSDRFRTWLRWGIMGGAFAAYLVGTSLNPGKVNFVLGRYGNFFWFYLAAFGGIFFWLHLCQLIKPNRVLTAIGQSSLTIYLLHLLAFPLITGVLTLILQIPNDSLKGVWWAAMLYTSITAASLIPVHYCLNQYLPWLVGHNPRRRSP
ncbi:MAG: acyltransferase family protein, partial [Spirulina sp. SIO3F2]|nr:acyltransferase family protein [Spirulina sp. SIO3F2]